MVWRHPAKRGLLGLIKPTSGTGSIFNHDINRESLKIRARVGYLPQDSVYHTGRTLLEEAGTAFDDLNRLHERIREIGDEISAIQSQIFGLERRPGSQLPSEPPDELQQGAGIPVPSG